MATSSARPLAAAPVSSANRVTPRARVSFAPGRQDRPCLLPLLLLLLLLLYSSRTAVEGSRIEHRKQLYISKSKPSYLKHVATKKKRVSRAATAVGRQSVFCAQGVRALSLPNRPLTSQHGFTPPKISLRCVCALSRAFRRFCRLLSPRMDRGSGDLRPCATLQGAGVLSAALAENTLSPHLAQYAAHPSTITSSPRRRARPPPMSARLLHLQPNRHHVLPHASRHHEPPEAKIRVVSSPGARP